MKSGKKQSKPDNNKHATDNKAAEMRDWLAQYDKLEEYYQDLGLNLKEVLNKKFTKLIPTSSRPYGNI